MASTQLHVSNVCGVDTNTKNAISEKKALIEYTSTQNGVAYTYIGTFTRFASFVSASLTDCVFAWRAYNSGHANLLRNEYYEPFFHPGRYLFNSSTAERTGISNAGTLVLSLFI